MWAANGARMQILKVGRPPPHPPIVEFMRDEAKLAGVRLDADLSACERLGPPPLVSMLDYAAAADKAVADGVQGELVSELPETPLQVRPSS
jgi:hypothetical protein